MKRFILPHTLFFLFSFLSLHLFCEYHYPFLEQNQLFLWTFDYFEERFLLPGGLTFWASECLTQFFFYPYVGAFVSALLYTSVGLWMQLLYERFSSQRRFSLLFFLPAVALFVSSLDFNTLLQYTLAFVAMQKTLYAYLCLVEKRWKPLYAVGLAVLLWWMAGAVVLLYALAVCMCEGLWRKSWHGVGTLFVALSCAAFGFVCGWSPTWQHAFLPDAYYHLTLSPHANLYFPLISLPLLLLFFVFLAKRSVYKWGYWCAEGVVIGALCVAGFYHYYDHNSAFTKRMDYAIRTEQWGEVKRLCQGKPQTNYMAMAYLNVALAREGRLAEDLFRFDQHGGKGLVLGWNQQFFPSIINSEVYYAMGNTAKSQEMAFEAFVSAQGTGSGRMLQRLVQTNLINGAYPVARKYINLLEKTTVYKDWATAHRRFLDNDEAVLRDPELGGRRRCLPAKNFLADNRGVLYDLERLAEGESTLDAPKHYLGALMLFAKDLPRFKTFMETYYTKAQTDKPIPRAFQEALMIVYSKDAESLAAYNLHPNIKQAFTAYEKNFIANRKHPNLRGLFAKTYGQTYWFYFLFK